MILSGPQRTMKMGASSDIFWAAAGERRSIHPGAVEPVYEYGLDALEAQRTVALAQKRVAREGIYRFCAASFASRQEGGDDASRLSLLLRFGCAQEEHYRLRAVGRSTRREA